MLLGGVEEQMERESGFLFPNDFLILDEAHTVEQTASRQIGTVISQYLLRATVQRLYNARSKKGLFTVTRDAEGVRLAAEIVDEIDKFFEALGARCDFRKGREFRVRQLGGRGALLVALGQVLDADNGVHGILWYVSMKLPVGQ